MVMKNEVLKKDSLSEKEDSLSKKYIGVIL